MDFVGKRKIWYFLSLLVIIPGLFSLAVQGFNFGIDFAGGNLLQVKFQDETTIEEVRTALEKINLQDSAIQPSEDNTFIIKTSVVDESQQDQVVNTLEKEIGSLEILRSEKVGPTIGKELRNAGILSLSIAIPLMIVYITIRFEFKFALAGIIALVHDILVTLGIFSIFQLEVDSTFIAAILTIFGYSINDTIVIFDRIRENLRMQKSKKLELIPLINQSIKQSLTRSINTTISTLFVLIALFFFGGETTRLFALAIIIGIAAGAYSSIFIASPLWYEMKKTEANS
ncbi:MAG: protein translocase subunit SecF [Clostridia bacterium]|nr:protein translocase subunit SecF [Clostridia bacterium]